MGGLGESIRKGVGMVHGTGEAIRGNFNAAIDQAAGDKSSATKNQEIAQKGVDEWDRGYRGHALGSEPAHGVGHHAPGTATSSTNAGPHSTNMANKADPRIDSDMDHRANPTSGMGPSSAATGSSNAGHHQSNFANKLDPRVDSDMDHRADPMSRVGIQGAGAGGVGGVGSTNAGPHASNLGNKVDPRVDSDLDGRRNAGNTGAGF